MLFYAVFTKFAIFFGITGACNFHQVVQTFIEFTNFHDEFFSVPFLHNRFYEMQAQVKRSLCFLLVSLFLNKVFVPSLIVPRKYLNAFVAHFLDLNFDVYVTSTPPLVQS